jgi:hypothetical protein
MITEAHLQLLPDLGVGKIAKTLLADFVVHVLIAARQAGADGRRADRKS